MMRIFTAIRVHGQWNCSSFATHATNLGARKVPHTRPRELSCCKRLIARTQSGSSSSTNYGSRYDLVL